MNKNNSLCNMNNNVTEKERQSEITILYNKQGQNGTERQNSIIK